MSVLAYGVCESLCSARFITGLIPSARPCTWVVATPAVKPGRYKYRAQTWVY